MIETPIARSKRVFRELTPHDLNSLERGNKSESRAKHDVSRQLIKTMSAQKSSSQTQSLSNPVRRIDSNKYTVEFPPGAMGLNLEPVIISHDPERKLGCKVKAFYFDESYSGISKEILCAHISVGDVLDNIDGSNVYLSPFDDILHMLRTRIQHRKIIGFKIINADIESLRSQKNPFSTGADEFVSDHPQLSTPPSATQGLREVHVGTPHPTPRAPPVLSPEKDKFLRLEAVSPRSPRTPRTPTSLSFLATVDDLSLLHLDTLRSLFPVRFDELSHLLSDLGANIGSGLLDAGVAIENRTEKVLEQTAHRIPLYSREDIDRVNGRVKMLLQELSETCMRLGTSESHLMEAERELAEIKISEARERERSSKLQSALSSLTNRLDDMGIELGAEQGDRDAWMMRAEAAEESAEHAKATLESLQNRYDQLLVEFQNYHYETENALRESRTAQGRDEQDFEQEVEDMRRQYDELRSEMELTVRKMKDEQNRIERERDVALAELEVIRDISGTERKSIDNEKSRIKEALNTQQKLHMQRILENEEAIHQLQSECSELQVALSKATSQCTHLQAAKSALESKLMSASELQAQSEKSVTKLELELQKARDELKSTSADIREKKNECARLSDHVAELEMKVDGLYRSLQSSKATEEAHEEHISKLEKDLRESQRDAIGKASALAEVEAIVAELREEVESQSKHSVDQMNRQRVRFENREAELLATVLAGERRVSQLELGVTKLKTTNESLDKKNDSLSDELATCTAMLRRKETSLEEVLARLSDVENDHRQLESRLNKEQQRNERYETMKLSYESEIETLQNTLRQTQEENKDVKGNLETMRHLAIKANAEVNLKSVELEEMQSQLSQSYHEGSQAQRNLVESQAAYLKLKRNFAQIRSMMNSALPQLRVDSANIVTDVKRQLAEFQETNHQATLQCLQFLRHRECSSCKRLEIELGDAIEEAAKSRQELDAQIQEKLVTVKECHDRMEEYSARYSAAAVEASILREQLERINDERSRSKESQISDLDLNYEQETNYSQAREVTSCGENKSAVDTVNERSKSPLPLTSTQSDLSDWNLKYGAELLEISNMHASIAHMVQRHRLNPSPEISASPARSEIPSTNSGDISKPAQLMECLQRQLTAAHIALESSENELFETRQQLREVNEQQAANVPTISDIARLKDELDRAQDANATLRSRLDFLQDDTSRRSNDIDCAHRDLMAERDEYFKELCDLKNQLAAQAKELMRSRELQKETARATEDQLTQATLRCNKLEIRIRSLVEEQEQAARYKLEVDTNMKYLSAEVQSKEKTLNLLKERYESELYDVRSEHESLRNKHMETEDKLLFNAERNAKKQSALEQERDRLSAALLQAQKEVEQSNMESEAKFVQLQTELRASRCAIETLTSRFEEELSKSRASYADLQVTSQNNERELLDTIKSLNMAEMKNFQSAQRLVQIEAEKEQICRELVELREYRVTRESVHVVERIVDQVEIATAESPSSQSACDDTNTSHASDATRDEMLSSLVFQLQTVVQEAQSREQEWARTRSTLNNIIEEWRARASEAISKSLALERKNISLKSEVARLEEERCTLQTLVSGRDKELHKMQHIVRTLEEKAIESTSSSCAASVVQIAREEDVDSARDTSDNQEYSSEEYDSGVSHLSSLRASRESMTSQVSVYSGNNVSDIRDWGSGASGMMSASLIRQLEISMRQNEVLSATSSEYMAKAECLQLQIEEMETLIRHRVTTPRDDYKNAAVQLSSWKAAMKMILKAWRASRKLVSKQSAIIASHVDNAIDSSALGHVFFSREEMECIRSIADETLSPEVCSDLFAVAEKGHISTSKCNESPRRPVEDFPQSPVLSPMREASEWDEENESTLWYVSSFDEEPGDIMR